MLLSSLPVPARTKLEFRRLPGNNKLAELVLVDYHPLVGSESTAGATTSEDRKFTSKNKTLLLSDTCCSAVPRYSVFVQRHVTGNTCSQMRVSLTEGRQNETTHPHTHIRARTYVYLQEKTHRHRAVQAPGGPFALDYIRQNCKNRVIVVLAYPVG